MLLTVANMFHHEYKTVHDYVSTKQKPETFVLCCGGSLVVVAVKHPCLTPRRKVLCANPNVHLLMDIKTYAFFFFL